MKGGGESRGGRGPGFLVEQGIAGSGEELEDGGADDLHLNGYGPLIHLEQRPRRAK